MTPGAAHAAWIPCDKHDLRRAEAAVAAGYPAVEPVLPALMEWLQDLNWPVARVLAPFLASIGAPLLPHVRAVLASGDDVWKYGIVGRLVGESDVLPRQLRAELVRLVEAPTASEIAEDLPEIAREVLERG